MSISRLWWSSMTLRASSSPWWSHCSYFIVDLETMLDAFCSSPHLQNLCLSSVASYVARDPQNSCSKPPNLVYFYYLIINPLFSHLW
jgi:hypothetical protein